MSSSFTSLQGPGRRQTYRLAVDAGDVARDGDAGEDAALGRLKHLVFCAPPFADLESWGGSTFHRFLLPSNPGAAQQLCV